MTQGPTALEAMRTPGSELTAMSAHADALRVLDSWSAPTGAQEGLRSQYVAHLRARPDALARTCLPAHLTAGVLVVSEDGDQVLLNLHRKAKRWFHFGGHIEATDESLAEAALREATEESGITTLRLEPSPAHLSSHVVPFCGSQGEEMHLDVRYVARVPRGTEPRGSDESLEVRWFDVTDLPTDEPDMRELVALSGGRDLRR